MLAGVCERARKADAAVVRPWSCTASAVDMIFLMRPTVMQLSGDEPLLLLGGATVLGKAASIG